MRVQRLLNLVLAVGFRGVICALVERIELAIAERRDGESAALSALERNQSSRRAGDKP